MENVNFETQPQQLPYPHVDRSLWQNGDIFSKPEGGRDPLLWQAYHQAPWFSHPGLQHIDEGVRDELHRLDSVFYPAMENARIRLNSVQDQLRYNARLGVDGSNHIGGSVADDFFQRHGNANRIGRDRYNATRNSITRVNRIERLGMLGRNAQSAYAHNEMVESIMRNSLRRAVDNSRDSYQVGMSYNPNIIIEGENEQFLSGDRHSDTYSEPRHSPVNFFDDSDAISVGSD